MRFMRLPILMVLIALAASVSPQFDFLLRFGAMALAALTVLGALSDMNGAARRADGMGREELLKLWFGGRLRERHTWEALTDDVYTLASALRLPSLARPALPPPNPLTNGHRSPSNKKAATKSEATAETASDLQATAAPPTAAPRPALLPMLRVLGIEAVSEAAVIAAILLNWFLPAPQTTQGEQLALLVTGLLALGLLWFDWRLMRRFVGAVQREVARLTPQTPASATSAG